jgi:hypothetical protein
MLGNIERAINNGQSRENGNTGHTTGTKTQHTMCWTPLYAYKHKQRQYDFTISRFVMTVMLSFYIIELFS